MNEIGKKIRQAIHNYHLEHGYANEPKYLIVGYEMLQCVMEGLSWTDLEVKKTGAYCFGLMIVIPSIGCGEPENTNTLEVR